MKKILNLVFAISALSAPANNENYNNMKVIAHRGGASLGPENTITCIERGINSGADAIEVDVHLSLDGFLVVCHDETINRTTNEKGRIEELTLSQIRNAEINYEGIKERIPTLKDVLLTVKDKCPLLLEVKKSRDNQYPLIEDKIVALVDSLGMRDQIVLQSFNDSVLNRFHIIAPDIPTEKLLVCMLPFGLAYDIRVHRFSINDYPNVRSFNIYNGLATQGFINEIHKKGKIVKVWTVDKPQKVKRNVDAVITNCPQAFIEH